MSRAKEYRSRKRERLSKLTVEATGETFIVRRVAIDAWIMAGKMPETLAREVLSAWHQMGADQAVENMSVDQLMSGFQVVRDLVLAACVSPKLVAGDVEADPDKDEIHFAELEAEERTALIAYCMNGAGATPIENTNGNLTAEAVSTFLKAENGAHLFLLAKTGERFGTRPSELLRIDPDDALALQVDIAADLHLRLLEAKEAERINERMEAMKHGHR